MNKKIWIALLLSLCLLLTAFAAVAEEEEFIQEEYENNICIDFDGYVGVFRVLENDWMGGTAEAEYGMISTLGRAGMTVGEVLTESGYFSMEPVLEGDVFEGWMLYGSVVTYDEFGFEEISYELLSGDVLYTHEEMLALPVPEYDIVLTAKWAGIPMEDYYAEVEMDWEDLYIGGTFTVLTEEGEILFNEEGEEAAYPSYTYWMDEEGQCLTDVTGEGGWAAISGLKNEGKTFIGWTVYEAVNLYWGPEIPEEENTVGYLVSSYEGENLYVIMVDGVVYGENLTTEEICAIAVTDSNFMAVAMWE